MEGVNVTAMIGRVVDDGVEKMIVLINIVHIVNKMIDLCGL